MQPPATPFSPNGARSLLCNHHRREKNISGPLIQRELKEGESLRVSSGSVVAFATTVQYDVQTVPGFKNVVFGGEGLFITKLTG